MSAMLDHLRTLLVNLCVCGPALYVGVLMIVDPASLVISLRALVGALQALVDQRFHGLQWQAPMRASEARNVSPTVRLALRFTGLALALCAVVFLADAMK
jgi:hypothetical protein